MATQENKKSNKKTLLIVLAFVVLLSVIGALVYLLLVKKEPEVPAAAGRNASVTVVTEDNAGLVFEDLQKKVADGMFRMRMTTDWAFETGSSASSNAYVANAETNTKTIYFVVTLDETGEVLFTSPDIPVGSKVEKFKLDKELPVGSHTATLQYHLLDNEGNEVSSVGVAITLNIQN